MKKIILLLSIPCLVMLSGCDNLDTPLDTDTGIYPAQRKSECASLSGLYIDKYNESDLCITRTGYILKVR